MGWGEGEGWLVGGGEEGVGRPGFDSRFHRGSFVIGGLLSLGVFCHRGSFVIGGLLSSGVFCHGGLLSSGVFCHRGSLARSSQATDLDIGTPVVVLPGAWRGGVSAGPVGPVSLYCDLGECNDPGVVQRRDRQKKEFHDQSDYR